MWLNVVGKKSIETKNHKKKSCKIPEKKISTYAPILKQAIEKHLGSCIC